MKKIKNQITATRLVRNKLILRSLRDNLNEQWKRLNVIKQEIGSSSWVSTLPNSDEEYMMTKQLFWDLVRTRYGWTLYCLPDKCTCVEKFNLQHTLSCKNGGFVSIQHNQIRRNITGSLMSEVCKDVKIESTLQRNWKHRRRTPVRCVLEVFGTLGS